ERPGLRDSLDPPDLRAPLARPDRRARRVTPVRHRQFGSSPVLIAFAAETTKSWLVLFARAVRPTERSARLPARQHPGYVYVGDLGHRVATSSTFSKQKSFNASSPGPRTPLAALGKRARAVIGTARARPRPKKLGAFSAPAG